MAVPLTPREGELKLSLKQNGPLQTIKAGRTEVRPYT